MRRSCAVLGWFLLAVSSACSSDPDQEASDPTAGTASVLRCPDLLAQASRATHGFGPGAAARAAPLLPRPEAGVVCAYQSLIVERDADGAQLEWRRVGAAVPLTAEQLAPIAADLTALEPPPQSYGCNDDLGPRWLLLYESGTRAVGVVVDDFGCRNVRLTSDPAAVVAGEDPDPELVRGVLFGPRFFEQRLNVAAGGQLKAR